MSDKYETYAEMGIWGCRCRVIVRYVVGYLPEGWGIGLC